MNDYGKRAQKGSRKYHYAFKGEKYIARRKLKNEKEKISDEKITGANAKIDKLNELLGEFAPKEYFERKAARKERNRIPTQAERIVAKFGGVNKIVDALRSVGWQISKSTVYKWNYPRSRGGTAGHIPISDYAWIEEAALACGLILDDVMYNVKEMRKVYRRFHEKDKK